MSGKILFMFESLTTKRIFGKKLHTHKNGITANLFCRRMCVDLKKDYKFFSQEKLSAIANRRKNNY